MPKLYYLAQPYSVDPVLSYYTAINNTNELLDKGYIVFSPIAYCHKLHLAKERDWEFWVKMDLLLLEKCDVLILAKGWENSKGCVIEHEKAVELGMEIILYERMEGI